MDEIRSKLQQLKERLLRCLDNTNETDINQYLLSATLRIWAANKQYSEAYKQALCAFNGAHYSAAQIVTALDCIGGESRRLVIPQFFQEIVKLDQAKGSAESRNLVESIGTLLADFALSNGDFTIEEAVALKKILDQLNEYCDHCKIPKGRPLAYRPEMITERNLTSYSLDPEHEDSPDSAKPSIQPVSTEKSSQQPPIDQAPITIKDENGGLTFTPNLSSDEEKEKDASVGVSIERHNNPENSQDTLESVLAELNSLVGLEKVKLDVQSLLNFIRICKIRTERGMKVPTMSYHLVFTGNPGTGKTTVARLVAKLYYLMGILPSDQLVETDRSGLVAGYLGQTAIKTQKVIQEALGGVLFIDEAYSLANDEEDSYGKEAIEAILKAMEDHRDELVVIVAGYDKLMHKFIDSNPGLRSRFNKYFHFPDYDGDEMLRILERFCETNGYVLADDTKPFLEKKLNELYQQREEHFGNARAIRNLFEHAINLQASRLVTDPELTNEELATLTPDDILPAMEVM